jgi:hypothetical protein
MFMSHGQRSNPRKEVTRSCGWYDVGVDRRKGRKKSVSALFVLAIKPRMGLADSAREQAQRFQLSLAS